MSMLSTSVIRGVGEIGPYQLLEDLGPAPFGIAYMAMDSRTDQRALLKVIHPGVQREDTPLEVLLQETRALLGLYHRGIPPLFEIAEHDGMLVVAFAPVVGSTLHDLMVQGRRPNRGLLVDWGWQVLEILAEAHAAGIVHRHVSEDQIVVTPDGRLVLMGFGLTQIHFDPLAAFPPERSTGQPLTPQSDLYAVGLLLRRLAFASGLRGGRGAREPRRDPLLKVLARATFPHPAARYRDAREMADALRQAGRAVAPAPAPRPVRSVSRAETPAPPKPVLVKLPARPEPAKVKTAPELEGREDRKLAILLFTAAVVLLMMLIAAGWFLIRRDGAAQPVLPAGAASSTFPRMPSPG